jgi:mannose-6-phosphate isomerase-like protein (cupin superfamily)
MTSFYDVPGEYGYQLAGSAYGFENLSFIITETHPHGGPPLHTHKTEEAHVVLSGIMDYVIGDKRFTATAPYIARVPAGVPHTFVNSGTTPLNMIAVFPTAELDYTPIGPNPLVEK